GHRPAAALHGLLRLGGGPARGGARRGCVARGGGPARRRALLRPRRAVALGDAAPGWAPRQPGALPGRRARELTPPGALRLEQVARPGAVLAGHVARVEQPARLERQAAAPDAAVEAVAQRLEQPDLRVQAGAPRRREPSPVLVVRSAVVGQGVERLADLLQRQPHLLGDPDERHPAEHLALVASLSTGGAGGLDEALVLVEPQRGRCDAGALAQRADRQLPLEAHGCTVRGTGP